MESCVCGFHIYKDIWIPATVEVLSCKGEGGNIMDSYNNDVLQSTVTVAHDAAKEIPWVKKPPCRRFVYRNNPSCCKILGCMHA